MSDDFGSSGDLDGAGIGYGDAGDRDLSPPGQDGLNGGGTQRPYWQRDTYVFPRPSRIRSPHHRFHPASWAVVILVLGLIAGLGTWFGNFEYGSETSVVFTVKQVTDQATGSGHQYMVFTYEAGTRTPAEVFKNTDAWFHGKSSSSNLQNYLTAGVTYRCTVYGYRDTWLSTYRDLLVCSQITVAQAQHQYASERIHAVSLGPPGGPPPGITRATQVDLAA